MLDILEAVLFAILLHLARFEDLPAHRQVDARFDRLHGSDRHADIKYRIGGLETGRAQRARKDDSLSGNAGQDVRGFDHGICTVADHVTLSVIVLDVIPQFLTVVVGQFQAVLAEHCNDVVVKINQTLGQYVLDLRFADLELTHVVEINLVDRTARCYESYKHLMTQSLTSPAIISV